MKLVINSCYGGFSISLETARWMAERGHTTAQAEVDRYDKGDKYIKDYLTTGVWACPKEELPWLEIDAKYGKKRRWYSGHDYERNDPLLVQAVETLGETANGECAALKVVEIPDGIKWGIDEYDGIEHVEEQHQTWS